MNTVENVAPVLTEATVDVICEVLGVPLLPGDAATVTDLVNGQLRRVEALERTVDRDTLETTEPFHGFDGTDVVHDERRAGVGGTSSD